MTQPPLPPLPDYWHAGQERQDVVNALFDRSAAHYDWICAAMSFGSGQTYRREALQRAGLRPGMSVLDVGTGTGLVAREVACVLGSPRNVIGVDPSSNMLSAGREHLAIPFVRGVGERLPFLECTFDFLTMGNALRHVSDLDETFREYFRVLKPGGRVLLLEITRPTSEVGVALARVYFGRIVPFVTRIGTGSPDAARLMRFYWETIVQCVPAATVLASLKRAGFSTTDRIVLHGIFTEYRATR